MTPRDFTITVTDTPGPEARAVIMGGLNGYNREKAGYWDSRTLAVLVSDPESREVIGGVLGHTSLGLAFIDLVFLPETARGHDVGRRMMQEAEDEARRRDCRSVVLYTISFQAPGFYERHGYRVLGTIPCNPPGTSRIFLTKALG
jgi:GNAT superfamily N-acetyltransferase